MANNRMYLKCTECEGKFYLAKYYPSTAWYWPALSSETAYLEQLDVFFEQHQHETDMYGKNFTLEYEV